jgi:hypothetical protein
MTESQIVRMDDGAVNARILAKESKTDFRRVEAASVKMMTRLASAEAKRQFVRYFSTLQLNAHFVSVIARTRLQPEDIARVETLLREQLVAAADELNKGIDGAEALFNAHGITRVATYDTRPLELEVGIMSSAGRRYFEIINKLDQLMPMLHTLEVHEVMTADAVDRQRAHFKRMIRHLARSARNMASGLRRRMNALDALKAQRERLPTTQDNGAAESMEDSAAMTTGADGGAKVFAANASEQAHPD